jgi:multiple antibiotic resistance protein
MTEITMKLLSAILTLFLVMDPIGNISFFVSHLKDVREGRKTWVVVRESLIALLVLLFFLFFGPLLMQLLSVSEASLYLAGGVLLLLIALGMIFPGTTHLSVTTDDENHGEPFIVPLAIPLFAGPSTMATIMIFSSRPSSPQEPGWIWVVALVAAWFLSLAILILSPGVSRLLGQRGMTACERLMGMVLTVVAVQMFLNGIRLFMGTRMAAGPSIHLW